MQKVVHNRAQRKGSLRPSRKRLWIPGLALYDKGQRWQRAAERIEGQRGCEAGFRHEKKTTQKPNENASQSHEKSENTETKRK